MTELNKHIDTLADQIMAEVRSGKLVQDVTLAMFNADPNLSADALADACKIVSERFAQKSEALRQMAHHKAKSERAEREVI